MLEDHKTHVHEIVVAFLISEPSHWAGIGIVLVVYFIAMGGVVVISDKLNIGGDL